MSNASQTLNVTQGRLVFHRHLPSPPGLVWQFLVEDEKRGEWLCRGLVEPKAGGVIEFKFDPEDFGDPRPEHMSDTAYTAEFTGTVVTYEPERVLAFTWPSGGGRPDTLVTMTLTPKGEGTDLQLVHERITDDGDMVGSAAGWHTHMELLECRLSQKATPNFFQRHDALEEDYKARIAKIRAS